MSLLDELFAVEKKSETQIAEKKSADAISPPLLSVAPALSPPPVHPCPACQSPLLWISPYDLTLRCRECQPPPSRSLMRGLFAVVPGELGGPERLVLIAGDDPAELAAGQADQATTLAESSSSNPRDPARNLPDWMFSPPVNFGDGKSQAQPGECTRCRSREFTETPIRPGWYRRDCAACGLTRENASESSPEAIPPRRTPQGFSGGRTRDMADESYREPNPGCERDWRGSGGKCLHATAGKLVRPLTLVSSARQGGTSVRLQQEPIALTLAEEQTSRGVKCVCTACGKFVGYKHEKKTSSKAGSKSDEDDSD